MTQLTIAGSFARKSAALALLIGVLFNAPITAMADEGGRSFWLPGSYGSLAATPGQPGWAFATVYYHTSVSAEGSVAAAREVRIGNFSTTATVNLNVNLQSDADLVLLNPMYTFATPVFGGQLTLGMITIVGRNKTSLDGIITAGVGGFSTTRSGSIDSSLTGFGDLYPKAELRWNMGVNNFMTYVTGDIPVGAYDPSRLANLGMGHGAIDGGFGYTYFNPKSGFEVSAVTGLTYNFKNPDTNYRSGVDWHLDWGISQFLSKQFHIGAVGYLYEQLTADSGAAAFLGDMKSHVAGIGPQIGYIFPFGDKQGYLNLKGYYEFDAANRADGWNVWLTFVVSPAAATPVAPTRRMVTK